MGCVYCATCLHNNKKYIGKTKGALEIRRTQHHSSSRTSCRSLFHHALRKYGIASFQWDTLFESDDELLLYQKEREFIAALNTRRPYGYNLTSGGDGNYNVHFDDEWRQKNQQRADALGQKVYCVETDKTYRSYAHASKETGVPPTNIRHCCNSKKHLTHSGLHFAFATDSEVENLRQLKATSRLEKKVEFSPERSEKVRQRLTGRKMSPEFCAHRRQIMMECNPWKGQHPSADVLQKMSDRRKGKLLGESNPSARKVLCVELDRVFSTMLEAVTVLGLPKAGTSNISSCCTGKLKTAYKYHWQYADEPTLP